MYMRIVSMPLEVMATGSSIDITQGSLTCPSFTDTGPPFYTGHPFIRHTAQFSRLLRHAGDTEDVFSNYPPPGILMGVDLSKKPQ